MSSRLLENQGSGFITGGFFSLSERGLASPFGGPRSPTTWLGGVRRLEFDSFRFNSTRLDSVQSARRQTRSGDETDWEGAARRESTARRSRFQRRFERSITDNANRSKESFGQRKIVGNRFESGIGRSPYTSFPPPLQCQFVARGRFYSGSATKLASIRRFAERDDFSVSLPTA